MTVITTFQKNDQRFCKHAHTHNAKVMSLLQTLNQNIDDISNSFKNIEGTYKRIDTYIESMKDSIGRIDELLELKNRNHENRPSCIPGFYKTPTPPKPNKSSTTTAGLAAIRCKHYR